MPVVRRGKLFRAIGPDLALRGRERAGRRGQDEEFAARGGRGSSMSELSRQEGARLRRQRALR
jgi:hypothetical protein